VVNDWAIVGSRRSTIPASQFSGSWVSFYRRTEGVWSHDDTIHVEIGHAVVNLGGPTLAGSGDLLVAADSPSNPERGAAGVFRRVGDEWIHEAAIWATQGPFEQGSFGDIWNVPVAAQGDRVFVGGEVVAPWEKAVFVYRYVDGEWTDDDILVIPSVGARLDGSIAVLDGLLIVGGRRLEGETHVGTAWVYEEAADNDWILVRTFEAPHPDDHRYGELVHASGSLIITGAPGTEETQGSVLIYSYPQTDCDGNGVLDACDLLNGAVDDSNANGIIDRCEFVCSADIAPEGAIDGVVDFADLQLLLQQWGTECPCTADVWPWPLGDGVVDVSDLLQLLEEWGACE